MSTSASITNRIVRTSSLPERPNRPLGAGSWIATGRSVVAIVIQESPKSIMPALSTASTAEFDAERVQLAYDAPHPTWRQTTVEIGHGGSLSNLRQAGYAPVYRRSP